VQDRFIAPPGLIEIEVVLRKAARIHHAEMRIDTRPLIRSGLTAIIETGPDERAGEPGSHGKNIPPTFRGAPAAPLRIDVIVVIRPRIAALAVAGVNAARANRTPLLCANVRLRGMLLVIAVSRRAQIIIPSAHFD